MKTISNRFFLIVGIIVAILSSCHNEIDTALDSADALMDSDPAMAQLILDSMKMDGTGRERELLHALLREKAEIKQHRNIESDSIAKVVMSYYNGRRDSLEVLSKLYYGMALRQQNKFEEAMIPLFFAYDLAEKLKEYKSAGMAARELAYINGRLFIFEDQLKWAELEVENYKMGNLVLHEAWANLDLIEALARNNRLQEAEGLIGFLDSVRPDNNPQYISRLNFYRPWLAYLQGNPRKSVQLYEEAIEKGRRIGANVWYIIGKNYIATGDREKATDALAKIRPIAKKPLDSIWALDLEARIAAMDGDYRKAYEKSSKFGSAMMAENDSLLSHPATSELIDSLRENYNLEQEKNAAERQAKFLLISLSISLTVIFLGLLLWVFVRLRAKSRENKLIGLEVTTLRKDVESLNEKADIREKEAAERIQSLLKDRLKPLNSLYELWFRNSEPTGKNKGDLVKELENLRSEKNVEELERMINEYCDDWMKRFRTTFPDLPKEHYTFAMYTFIGLSNEAIAILLNKKTLNTVYGVKGRLKEKLARNDSEEAKAFIVRLALT